MPEIVERDGKYCLEGYGDADACYDSREEADAAAAKMGGMDKAAAPPQQEETTADDAAPPASEEGEPEQDDATTAVVDVPPSIRQLVLRIGAQAVEATEAVAKAFGRRRDEATGFKVVGNHWVAVWSNNFKDRDGELFPERAIDAYVRRVDTGMTPLPELWVWHAGKNVSIGSADWVGRHGHFLVAAGQFYGAEAAQTAKRYYAKHAKDTGISHGFTYPADQFDGKAYGSFNTFEISLLPRGSEANLYTSLEGVKAMALDDKKVQYLKEVFDEHAERILADLDKRGKALEDLGVEFKDFADPALLDANKQVSISADKALGDLLTDVLTTSAEPILAATEAVKQVKALRVEMAALQREVAETKALVEQRPRASQNALTVVEPSHLSAAMQEQLKQQNTERDTFFGVDVVKTP